jgi:AraC-like DNA-binding protein
MDTLSNVLSLLNVRSAFSNGLKAGGAWAIQFSTVAGIKFNAVVEGTCWLALEGDIEPVRLQAGDCFLLKGGHRFVLASDLTLPRIGAADVFRDPVDGAAHIGTPADVFVIGGRFIFEPADASMLIDALPPFVHVDRDSAQATTLRWVLSHLAAELSDTRPGAQLMAEHLSHIMLVQVLRSFLASPARPATGWLAALSDPKIGPAMRLMHEAPATHWTLNDLARAASVSRSAFALRFKTIVGTAPLDYLLQWRMRLARRALRSDTASVSSIAASLGYASDSAFSSTFKRVTGRAPLQYRRESRTQPQTAAQAP